LSKHVVEIDPWLETLFSNSTFAKHPHISWDHEIV